MQEYKFKYKFKYKSGDYKFEDFWKDLIPMKEYNEQCFQVSNPVLIFYHIKNCVKNQTTKRNLNVSTRF